MQDTGNFEQQHPPEAFDEVSEFDFSLQVGENLGIKLNKELAVMSVAKGSPTDGKLEVADVVLSINGIPLKTVKQFDDVVAEGGAIRIVVQRGLKSAVQTLLPPERESYVRRRDGCIYQIVNIEHQRGCKFGLGIKHHQNRVIVSRVVDGSLSAQSLIVGDRIIDINGIPVSDKDVARDLLLKSLTKHRKVDMLIERSVSDEARQFAEQALVASQMQPPSVAMASDIREIVTRQKEKMKNHKVIQPKAGIMRKQNTAGHGRQVHLIGGEKEINIADDHEGKALKKVRVDAK